MKQHETCKQRNHFVSSRIILLSRSCETYYTRNDGMLIVTILRDRKICQNIKLSALIRLGDFNVMTKELGERRAE